MIFKNYLAFQLELEELASYTHEKSLFKKLKIIVIIIAINCIYYITIILLNP